MSDDDAERLTRDDMTAAVHFLKFRFAPAQVSAFRAGPVRIIVDHPEYHQEATLSDAQLASLAQDLTDVT
jgi:hypothetical protein